MAFLLVLHQEVPAGRKLPAMSSLSNVGVQYVVEQSGWYTSEIDVGVTVLLVNRYQSSVSALAYMYVYLLMGNYF